MKKALVFLVLTLTLLLCLTACHSHYFGEWFVTKNATCTEDGVKTRYCSCGEKQSDVIPFTGHNYVDGECTNCGDIKETSECKHNDFNILAAVDSTCTKTGLLCSRRSSPNVPASSL